MSPARRRRGRPSLRANPRPSRRARQQARSTRPMVRAAIEECRRRRTITAKQHDCASSHELSGCSRDLAAQHERSRDHAASASLPLLPPTTMRPRRSRSPARAPASPCTITMPPTCRPFRRRAARPGDRPRRHRPRSGRPLRRDAAKGPAFPWICNLPARISLPACSPTEPSTTISPAAMFAPTRSRRSEPPSKRSDIGSPMRKLKRSPTLSLSRAPSRSRRAIALSERLCKASGTRPERSIL